MALAKNLGALAFGCILAVALLEGALRIRNPFETRIRGDEIVLHAHKRYVFRDQQIDGLDSTIVHTTNSLGFRGPEPPAGGLAGHLSIVAIGGSTTEGFYISDGKTWPELLHEKLGTRFDRLWVNNAGFNGHTTFGHVVLMRDYVGRLRPRVALFLVGANEIGNDNFNTDDYEMVRSKLRFFSISALAKSLAAHSEVASLALNLYRYQRARLLGLPHQRIDLQQLETRPYPDPRLDAILTEHRTGYLPGYERRLRALLDETEKHSILPVLITQPTLAGAGIDDRTGVNLDAVMVGQYVGHTQWQLMQLYNDVTRRVAQERGVFLVDLATQVPKSSTLYYDFWHYTNKGAEVIATVLAEDLTPFLRKRFPEFVKRGSGKSEGAGRSTPR